MKLQILSTCTAVLCATASLQAAPIFENTYHWVDNDHSAWKGMTNDLDSYVIVGSKFFETSNTMIFMTGFNDFSQHEFTTTQPVTQHGFTRLETFWKSFTNIGDLSNPDGFFIAASGVRNGKNEYYTLQTDKAGQPVVERFGPLGGNIIFHGACPSPDGGYIAVGSAGFSNAALAKFNASGELQTTVSLPISGSAWTVQPAPGGGFVIGSGGRIATRVDAAFNIDWSTTVTLPAPPAPDTSLYSYSEFEEITPLENSAPGFIMTGSVFSSSTSAVYSARITWDGVVEWSKVNDFSDSSLTSTPVTWTNSAIERFSAQTGLWDVVYTWRKGPISPGGTMFFDRMNPASGATITSGSLLNNIPVQEAFTIRQPNSDRIVIAGTRGGYSAAYSYATCELPGEGDLTPPVVTCAGDVSQAADPGQCSAVVNYAAATARDNCDVGPLTITCIPPSGSAFPVGTTVVTCSATDSAGNTGTCTFNVTVTDAVAPAITCPASITTATLDFAPNATVFYPTPITTDTCPGTNVVFNPPSGSVFPLGTTNVTATATDAAGNTASCSFQVKVFDIILQDDSAPGRSLVVNSTTGEYIFCCDGATYTGNARVKTRRCNVKINVSIAGQSLSAVVNKCRHRGQAKLRLSRRSVCKIRDANLFDSRPACQ